MSAGLRRTSLFNRRFALSRKAALSLPAGKQSIRQDADGFDDLDEYFESPHHNTTDASQKEWVDERIEDANKIGHGELAARWGEMETVPANDDYERGAEEDDVENTMDDDNNELSFRETIKLTPSPARTAKSTTPKTIGIDKPRPNIDKKKPAQKRRSKFEPIVEVRVGDKDEIVRRSKRSRIPPLAYWRNEKVIYGRRQSSKMPVIVDVLRKDGADSPTKQIRSKHTGRRAFVKSSAGEIREELKKAGFRPQANVMAKVMDYDTHRETERLLALGPEAIETNTVNGEDFGIQTVFTEGSFLSSGILEFPPNSSKPSRNSSKHALVFYVIEGTVEVTIHETTFVIGTGSQFVVPRGNHYSIRSVWSKTTRMFFCHCKDTSTDS